MSTKKTILTILIIAAIFSCKNQNENKHMEKNQNASNSSLKVDSLSGKNFEYNYGNFIYEVNFKSETELHWKCIKGDDKGNEANENYHTFRLNNSTLFISWVEKDGLGVSQVLNLEDKSVKTFLKIDKEIIPLTGTIREF